MGRGNTRGDGGTGGTGGAGGNEALSIWEAPGLGNDLKLVLALPCNPAYIWWRIRASLLGSPAVSRAAREHPSKEAKH